MELFQVFWDDHENLFLEFKKNERDKEQFVPENIKRMNLKYELSKVNRNDPYRTEMPILVSIKKFFINTDFVLFSIDLDLMVEKDDLNINFLSLTAFFKSGKRIEISINQKFEMSEIYVNEDEITSLYQKRATVEETPVRTSFTQERVYQEVSRDKQNNKEKNTVVYEKKTIESVSGSNSLMAEIKINNDRLANVENYLKEITETLKHISFNGVSLGSNLSHALLDQPITRIRRVPTKSVALAPPGRPAFIGELKGVFSNVMKDKEILDFRDILKPMNDEELKAITLDEENLRKKELETFTRVIKKLENEETKTNQENKKEEEPIKLENLKKPKM
ncbi:MAG: hypothetical protein JW891_05620 [Candidatus Lokiarchaeota archaeon]|nr:hypothetical protein [Candidatus Lokiarchaeota archaeon]